MNLLFSAQEMARRNNENVAVFAAYQRRRGLRKLAGKKTKRTAKERDNLYWQAAEREARPLERWDSFLPGFESTLLLGLLSEVVRPTDSALDSQLSTQPHPTSSTRSGWKRSSTKRQVRLVRFSPSSSSL